MSICFWVLTPKHRCALSDTLRASLIKSVAVQWEPGVGGGTCLNMDREKYLYSATNLKVKLKGIGKVSA